jgi:hypothetical protein
MVPALAHKLSTDSIVCYLHKSMFCKVCEVRVTCRRRVAVGPAHARLHSERGGGAWCPRQVVSSRQEQQEFLQIDLLADHLIR